MTGSASARYSRSSGVGWALSANVPEIHEAAQQLCSGGSVATEARELRVIGCREGGIAALDVEIGAAIQRAP